MTKPAIKNNGFSISGMHHNGQTHFDIGETFKLVQKPNNNFDRNAIAVKDDNTTAANICKKEAASFACVINFNQSKLFYFKVKHKAIVRECRVDPEYKGTVGFFYDT